MNSSFENGEPASINYLGWPGDSNECVDAVMRLVLFGDRIILTRILTHASDHCLLLTINNDDLVAIKSGFSSGYIGTGPRALSYVLQLLHSHGSEIEEYGVDQEFIERVDSSLLTTLDLAKLEGSKVRSRWSDYIFEDDWELKEKGRIWKRFPHTLPLAIIDSRIMDLALVFWKDPDRNLIAGFRRLEDIVRKRSELDEHGAKLFSRAFLGNDSKLKWNDITEAENVGRTNLFTGAYSAHRNPRFHKELDESVTDQLSEFLILNHLYILEKQSISRT